MLIKHKNCVDTAMDVIKSFYIKEKDLYSMKVMWYRLHSVRPPECLYITQRLRLPKSQMPDWLPVPYNYRRAAPTHIALTSAFFNGATDEI